VSDAIKTWPSSMDPRKVLRIFSEDCPFADFYFTLGRGKPRRAIDNLWFCYRGRILGYFKVREIVCNVGQLPRLCRLDGEPSAWQIKQGRFVAICDAPFHRLKERVYMDSFRGFHYFDFAAYSESSEAKIAI
jgi:hypothetical protein